MNDAAFAKALNSSESIDVAVQKIGMSKRYVIQRASDLRRSGLNVKRFSHRGPHGKCRVCGLQATTADLCAFHYERKRKGRPIDVPRRARGRSRVRFCFNCKSPVVRQSHQSRSFVVCSKCKKSVRPHMIHFSVEEVLDIRKRYGAGELPSVTARKYGVTARTISGIAMGRFYRDDLTGACCRVVKTCQGNSHPNSKVKEKDVKQIRRQSLRGIDVNVIATRYGMSVENVRRIISRKTWRHVS
jgi:hypothetical protein